MAYAQKGPGAAWTAQAKLTIVRGGTDGSRLTELGLPTPEPLLRRPHARIRRWNGRVWRKWSQSVEWLVEISQVWGEDRSEQ